MMHQIDDLCDAYPCNYVLAAVQDTLLWALDEQQPNTLITDICTMQRNHEECVDAEDTTVYRSLPTESQ